MTTPNVQLENIVNELQSKYHVDSAAIIRRDGVLMASNLPSDFRGKEVLALMTATIMGAAGNISIDNSLGSPSRIIVITEYGKIVISDAGTKALIVCFISSKNKRSELLDSLTSYEDQVKGMI